MGFELLRSSFGIIRCALSFFFLQPGDRTSWKKIRCVEEAYLNSNSFKQLAYL